MCIILLMIDVTVHLPRPLLAPVQLGATATRCWHQAGGAASPIKLGSLRLVCSICMHLSFCFLNAQPEKEGS